LPFCHRQLIAPKPLKTQYPKTLDRIGDHIRKRRLELGLLQRQAADQIGVAEATIFNWETGRATPAIRHFPGIVRFLGYPPFPPAQTLGEQLAMARRLTGWSQEKLAHQIGVDESTLRDWEAGRHKPVKQSLALIKKTLDGLPMVE
jgi:transcriptional regulator with XRE-family HTH domain